MKTNNVLKFPLRTTTDQLWWQAGQGMGDPSVILSRLSPEQRERLLSRLVLEALLDGCGPAAGAIKTEVDISNGYSKTL